MASSLSFSCFWYCLTNSWRSNHEQELHFCWVELARIALKKANYKPHPWHRHHNQQWDLLDILAISLRESLNETSQFDLVAIPSRLRACVPPFPSCLLPLPPIRVLGYSRDNQKIDVLYSDMKDALQLSGWHLPKVSVRLQSGSRSYVNDREHLQLHYGSSRTWKRSGREWVLKNLNVSRKNAPASCSQSSLDRSKLESAKKSLGTYAWSDRAKNRLWGREMGTRTSLTNSWEDSRTEDNCQYAFQRLDLSSGRWGRFGKKTYHWRPMPLLSAEAGVA